MGKAQLTYSLHIASELTLRELSLIVIYARTFHGNKSTDYLNGRDGIIKAARSFVLRNGERIELRIDELSDMRRIDFSPEDLDNARSLVLNYFPELRVL